MKQEGWERRAIRLLAVGLIIGLGAYWAGSRYGQPNHSSVSALPAPEEASETRLDPTET